MQKIIFPTEELKKSNNHTGLSLIFEMGGEGYEVVNVHFIIFFLSIGGVNGLFPFTIADKIPWSPVLIDNPVHIPHNKLL